MFFRSNPPQKSILPVARPGYPFIVLSALITACFAILGLGALALSGLFVTLFICYFFRDPKRVISERRGGVVSPADGRVISAGRLRDIEFFDGECNKISIFMSLFNVHVNRIPHDGKITKIRYVQGKFFSAYLDKASKKNEHNAVYLETEGGKKLCIVQIAGLIARRIICRIHENDHVVRGERFGMIRFGSRLDVYLPPEIKLHVEVGDKVKAGASVLGYLE
ncbi:MAG: phosphatidylserine decarboxylase family protein [Desulfobacterales bacterium]